MTPSVDGQLRALNQAYEDAGVSPTSVAYFEAHGTATSIGDPAEVEALGRRLTWLNMGAVPGLVLVFALAMVVFKVNRRSSS